MKDETSTFLESHASEPDAGSARVPTRYIPWVPLFGAVIAAGVYTIIFAVVAP